MMSSGDFGSLGLEYWNAFLACMATDIRGMAKGRI